MGSTFYMGNTAPPAQIAHLPKPPKGPAPGSAPKKSAPPPATTGPKSGIKIIWKISKSSMIIRSMVVVTTISFAIDWKLHETVEAMECR